MSKVAVVSGGESASLEPDSVPESSAICDRRYERKRSLTLVVRTPPLELGCGPQEKFEISSIF